MKIKLGYFDKHPLILKIVFCIFFGFWLLIMNGSIVKAASGPALSTTFPTNDRAGLPVYLTIGEGEFNVQGAGATILADIPGNVTVTIIDAGWCNSGGLEVPIPALTARPYKDTYFQAFDVYGSTGSYTIGAQRGRIDNPANTRECNASNLGVNKTMTFCVCSLIGSTGKYGAVIIGSIAGKPANYVMGSVSNGWTFESSFRFQISSSIGAAMTLTPPGIVDNLYSFSNKLITTAQTLNTSFFLTTPCTYNDSASITFFDVDNGVYQAGPSPYTPALMFYARSRAHSSATYDQIHAQGQITGGSNVYGSSFTIPLVGSRHYEFQVNGLTKPNSIAFTLTASADTLFAAENCPPPLPPGAAQCSLSTTTPTAAPGTKVTINATITNKSNKNWPYNSAQTNWNTSNFSFSPVDYTKGYAKLSQPNVDSVSSPGSSSGPPDWNNATFVVNEAVGTNTAPYFLPYSTYGNLVGTSGIVRFGMRSSIAVNGSQTYAFNVLAPTTVGATRTIGLRVLDRVPQVYPPYAWFNEFNPGGCTVTITAASPLSATCRFTSTPIIIEAGAYTPSVLVKNTSTVTGSFQPSFAISGKPTVTGFSTPINAGVETPINASTTVVFSSADERRWPMTVTVTWSGGSTTCTNDIDIVRKPIFNVTNGDLLVGGKYPSGNPASCENTANPTDANAYSWALSPVATAGDRKGASAEHVAKVLGTALEVYSARSIATTNVKLLTVANNIAANTWGGSSGGLTCMSDFYTDTIKTDAGTITSPYSLSTPSIPISQQVKITGNLNLNGTTNFSNKLAVYVTGDVYIENDIKMTTSYSSVSSIPFFALIVKGNIYVAPGVTQLDGMYVAQPNGASGGSIYTCGKNILGTFSEYTINEIYDYCRSNSLTFNGIVQAKKLRLHRVNGTMSTDVPAETFNNLPELYLTSTPFRDTTSDSAQYDSAATLPPLL